MPKILIYDDEERLSGKYANQLKKLSVVKEKFEIKSINNKDLEKDFKVLHSRRIRSRGTKKTDNQEKSEFDGVAIFIIDYDLLNTASTTIPEEGETLAYYTRCFSKCGLIIGLNQFDPIDLNTFDLSLRGHPESYADINIGSKQLDNPFLWSQEKKGFSPWYWPILPEFLESFQQRIDDSRKHLDEPIISTLGFPIPIPDMLPRSASEYLVGRSNRDLKQITFREFVLHSGNGLWPKDKLEGDEMIARVAAARVSKWIERLLLPGQDILVDAPHLVSRFPSLLQGKPENMTSWTATINRSEPSGIKTSVIKKYEFYKKYWISRSVWWWPLLSDDINILEIKEPWSASRPEWVFCEDNSIFIEENKAKEFVADTPSPYVRRYVQSIKGIKYRPTVRFSL